MDINRINVMTNLQEKPQYVLDPNFWAWWRAIEGLGGTRPLQGPETAKVCGRPKQWVIARYSDYGYQVVGRVATYKEAETVVEGLERWGHRCSISNANDGVDTYGPEILINRLYKRLLTAQHLAAVWRLAIVAQCAAEAEVAGLEARIEREILAVSLRAAKRGYVASLVRIGNVRLFHVQPIRREGL